MYFFLNGMLSFSVYIQKKMFVFVIIGFKDWLKTSPYKLALRSKSTVSVYIQKNNTAGSHRK